MEEMQAKEKPNFKAWMSEHSPVGAAGDAEKASQVYVLVMFLYLQKVFSQD